MSTVRSLVPMVGSTGPTSACGGYEIKRPDGNLLKGLDGVLFRCQPNGSNVEVFCDLGTATNTRRSRLHCRRRADCRGDPCPS